MDLATISAKQKRVKDWMEGLETTVQDRNLREKTADVLKQYRSVLFRCWDAQAINATDAQQIADLERQLERLNEEARMTVVPSGKRVA
jgi:hypothetical protein